MRCAALAMTLLFVLAAPLAAADAAAEDANAADLKRMQGDWMVASMRVSGMDLPDDEAQALFRTVEGNRYTVARYMKAMTQGTFRIDATQSPKTIDSTPDAKQGEKQSQPLRGIYEFDGDKLRICNGRPGQARPKNFDAKQFTGHTLIVWEPEAK